MSRKQRRRLLASLAISFIVGIVLSLAFWFNLFSGLQNVTTDLLFKNRAVVTQGPLSKDVVIVGIDEKTLGSLELGRWPFPRDVQAQLIEKLAQAKPRVITLDIGYFEPASGDDRLAKAIADAGNVILPALGEPPTPKEQKQGASLEYDQLTKPLPELAKGASAIGHANAYPDRDGTVRWSPLLIRSGSEELPSLGLATVAKYLRRPKVIESPPKDGLLSFVGREIPIDSSNRLVINYLGGPSRADRPSTFRVVSYIDVIKGNFDPQVFRDKIVLVGAMAAGIPDDYWTPVSTDRKMFGVEIHADVIENILRDDFLRPQPLANAIAIIIILSLFSGLLLPHIKLLWGILSIVALGGAYVFVSAYFFEQGVIFNILYPMLALVLSLIATITYRIVFEEADRREVNRLFGRYVSPQVRDEIITDAEAGQLKLGGMRQEVTVMFADIRGFTSLSEKLQPEEIVAMLNTYLSAMIAQVFKNEGMVNKFAGDNIMGVWNAPVEREHHSWLAVRAAVESQKLLEKMQQENAELPRVQFGIGINTGEAVAGNMGSEERAEYTVIGDAVNLASRLCSGATGGSVWISKETYERVKDSVVAENIGPQYFKGKAEPVEVYEVKDIIAEPVTPVRPSPATASEGPR